MEKNLNMRQAQDSSYVLDSVQNMFQAALQPVPRAGITEDNCISYAVSNTQNDKKLLETADHLPGGYWHGCWQQTPWSHLGTWRENTSLAALPVPPNFPSHSHLFTLVSHSLHYESQKPIHTPQLGTAEQLSNRPSL